MATSKKSPAAATPTTSTGGPSVVKKLSVSTVYGAIRVKDIPEGGELKLCRMAGIATATDSGSSTYGDWRCLVGECAATSYSTGEVMIGRSAFVPGAMGDALIDALNSAQREDAGASLKFSIDVSVKVSSRDENKYEYIVRPVIESNVKNEAMLLLGLEG